MSRRAVILLASLCTGCSFYMPNPPCPPPPSAKFPVTDTYSCDSSTTELCYPNPTEELGLSSLIDVALQNSPKTRSSWYRAKEAAAQLGTARGAYIPNIDFQAYWLKEQESDVNLNQEVVNFQREISMGFSTSYLLFDFGGRNAQLASAIAALTEANWQYDWDVQTVMITAVQQYYDYLQARGVLDAQEISLDIKLKTYEATKALREGGVHSLADELQAETTLLETMIETEHSRKTMNVNYVKLIQSLGLPPDSHITAAPLPDKIETTGVCSDMAVLLRAAKEHRSDLRAHRAFIEEQKAELISARSKFLPTIKTDTSGTKVSLNDLNFLDNYSIQFTLDVPLFNSFSDINEIRKAQAEILEAQAQLDDEELQAYLSVLTYYYDFIANAKVMEYSCNYVQTAAKNQEVAFANYKAGITTILDLMTANEALTRAMIQAVNAKTEFLTSIANISYSTGGLSINTIEQNQSVRPRLVETGEKIEVDLSCTN